MKEAERHLLIMPDILPTITGPDDVKKLSPNELRKLAAEIRKELIRVVYRNGGHLGSNLGTVELTLALHYCYDFANDRLVWDVGHQCYAHKLITGRSDRFDTLRCMGGLSGFPSKDESSFDPFTSGHSSTAISTALGLACGDDLLKCKRSVVAVVGDGAIASGMAFEALNHAGSLGRNLLVILNDNEMSISATVGAFSAYFTQLRSAPAYLEFKKEIGHFLDGLPLFGGQMKNALDHIKDAVRNSITPGRMFDDLGFRYFGPTDGHNLPELIETLKDVKDLGGPVLLHVVTEKGKGHEQAQNHQHRMHSVAPEKVTIQPPDGGRPGWTSKFSEHLAEVASHDTTIVAITAAMPDITAAFHEQFPGRHFDPGICEQHAVGLAAGLAAAGMKPVIAVYSTFLQRAYDQVFHEICLQKTPVVLVIDRAGLVGNDGPTHHGAFDIAYLRHLPEMTLMAPKDVPELRMMLEAALAWQRPCAIRFPRESAPEDFPGSTPVERGKAEIIREGADALIVAYGSMVYRAMQAAEALRDDGIEVGVVNARFAKPIDEDTILGLMEKSPATVIAEEGALAGGFGSAVLERASDRGPDAARARRLGIPDEFIEHGPRDELLKMLGLTAAGIATAVRQALEDAAK
jgi:1-deoxy-D-xylulose-5-phosphate synthase